MNTLIPNSWLKEYLDTKAAPKKIGECLSLCGPSVEKIEKKEGDWIYDIEVTTNRVDSIGVYGIAREAAAILPRFGIKAKLVNPKPKFKGKFKKKVGYLNAKVDPNLCSRFTAVLIRGVTIKPSPGIIQKRLKLIDLRPINNIVDISNYIMHELGQPVHTFDYDKIRGSKMLLRASKKGEKIITLDNKTHTLPGGDIVIEDGAKKLIDLAGIMGGLNSAVDKNTKNVLLFVQTYNPVNIRKTFTSLSQITEAAILFEKGLDMELVTLAILKGIDLFVELTGGKPEKEILDIYPAPFKGSKITTTFNFIINRLGMEISKGEIKKYLESLGFGISWKENRLEVQVPSFRANDVKIPEDIVEEVARIHGYHKLPSKIMQGAIPNPLIDVPFDFEMKVKNTLAQLGGNEVYTYSMVPKDWATLNALKIKNPLSKDKEYMRTNLRPSLIAAAEENAQETNPFHLFEMANTYLPRKGKLPEEKMMLAGIFANSQYRNAKGVIETLLEKLNLNCQVQIEDSNQFLPSHRIVFKVGNVRIGEFGVLKNKNIYYEFGVESLRGASKSISTYIPIPKYPPQIEDITLVLPKRTRVGEMLLSIKSVSKFVSNVELTDIYKDSHTFRIWYQDPKKTLTDREVEKIRVQLIKGVKNKFGASLKD